MAKVSEMRAKIEEIKKNAKLLELMILKDDISIKMTECASQAEYCAYESVKIMIEKRMEDINKHED